MSDYSKVYKELYEIFKYLPEELADKVPLEIINQIKNKMDKDYLYEVNHISDFRNQSMMKETRAMLAIFYRDYWSSEDERKEIIENERKEMLRSEEEKKNTYKDRSNIFKTKEYIEENDSNQIVKYKEGIFKKIFKKIILLFKKEKTSI